MIVESIYLRRSKCSLSATRLYRHVPVRTSVSTTCAYTICVRSVLPLSRGSLVGGHDCVMIELLMCVRFSQALLVVEALQCVADGRKCLFEPLELSTTS